VDLQGRNLLKETDLTAEEFRYLVDLGAQFAVAKHLGQRSGRLAGRNIALIFEKASTRTRSAFEVAAHDEGGHVTYLSPEDSHLGHKESVKDAARVLGRMFDGIEFRGFAQESAEILGAFAGVPVWNGLTDQWHPTQMLADILTMREHAGKPLDRVSYCYLGDGRNNTANSLLVTGALLGLDVRICAPDELWPAPETCDIARSLAARSGASLTAGGRLPLHRRLAVDGGAGGELGQADRPAASLSGERGNDGGDRERRRKVPALPARAAQRRHRDRAADPRLPRAGRARGD